MGFALLVGTLNNGPRASLRKITKYPGIDDRHYFLIFECCYNSARRPSSIYTETHRAGDRYTDPANLEKKPISFAQIAPETNHTPHDLNMAWLSSHLGKNPCFRSTLFRGSLREVVSYVDWSGSLVEWSYEETILQSHELLCAHILVNGAVVRDYAFAIRRSLGEQRLAWITWELSPKRTSTEH